MNNQKAEHLMAEIYQSITGFVDYEPLEKEAYEAENIYPLYGEILYSSLCKVIQELDIQPDDIIVDLGSGVGKIPMQFFLTTEVKKAIGIEGFSKRHRGAMQAREKLEEASPLLFKAGRNLIFIEGNFLQQDLSSATIIYIACFDETVLEELAVLLQKCLHLKYLISLKPIATPLRFSKEIELDYSFGPINAYIYKKG